MMMKKDWTYKKLGEVGTIIGGSTPKTDNPDFWDGDLAWITPAELDGSKYVSSTVRTITEKAVEKTNLTLLPIGTVLLSSRAPIGKVCITKIPMYCNQGFKNIVCSDELNNEYLYWWLKWKNEYLNTLGVGATFKEISKRIVEQITIPVPPLETQSQIVSELDLLQSIIDKQKAQLTEYDNLAHSIFYDMFGDPVENEKGWVTDILMSVAPQKQFYGSVPSEHGRCWLLNLDMVEQQTGLIIDKVMVNKEEIGSSTIIFDDTNVLYSKLRPYLNKVVVPYEIGYGTSEFLPLQPNPDILDRIFLANLLRSKAFVNYISVKVAGAKMPRVSMDILRTFPIILPPLSLQQSFAAKIESIEKQKAAINKSISESQKLFDYTMDKYFG